MDVFRSRLLGISVAVAHGVFSGSLNILLKFLITNYHFGFLTLIQLLTSSTAAITLETLRRLGKIRVPAFSAQLSKVTNISRQHTETTPTDRWSDDIGPTFRKVWSTDLKETVRVKVLQRNVTQVQGKIPEYEKIYRVKITVTC